MKNWITDSLPDSEITVMIRLSGDEYPVWPGYHDGEQWRSADGTTLEGLVLGWMEFDDAAELLDGEKLEVTGYSLQVGKGEGTPDSLQPDSLTACTGGAQ